MDFSKSAETPINCRVDMGPSVPQETRPNTERRAPEQAEVTTTANRALLLRSYKTTIEDVEDDGKVSFEGLDRKCVRFPYIPPKWVPGRGASGTQRNPYRHDISASKPKSSAHSSARPASLCECSNDDDIENRSRVAFKKSQETCQLRAKSGYGFSNVDRYKEYEPARHHTTSSKIPSSGSQHFGNEDVVRGAQTCGGPSAGLTVGNNKLYNIPGTVYSAPVDKGVSGVVWSGSHYFGNRVPVHIPDPHTGGTSLVYPIASSNATPASQSQSSPHNPYGQSPGALYNCCDNSALGTTTNPKSFSCASMPHTGFSASISSPRNTHIDHRITKCKLQQHVEYANRKPFSFVDYPNKFGNFHRDAADIDSKGRGPQVPATIKHASTTEPLTHFETESLKTMKQTAPDTETKSNTGHIKIIPYRKLVSDPGSNYDPGCAEKERAERMRTPGASVTVKIESEDDDNNYIPDLASTNFPTWSHASSTRSFTPAKKNTIEKGCRPMPFVTKDKVLAMLTETIEVQKNNTEMLNGIMRTLKRIEGQIAALDAQVTALGGNEDRVMTPGSSVADGQETELGMGW